MFDISGEWINQNRSLVRFDCAPDGTLSGSYVSRKGRAAAGKEYPLWGRRNGEVLNFLVDWRDDDHNLGAMTSFSGRLGRDADGRELIHTLWVLVRQWEDPEQSRATGTWNAFLTNSDVFQRRES